MSYIGHGLSHAIFGGYAAAPLLGIPIVLGAGAWGLGSALLINTVARSRKIGADAAIGVVTTASFALGVALLTRFGTKGPAFDALLFGSINGVERSDLLLLVCALVFAAGIFTVLLPGVPVLDLRPRRRRRLRRQRAADGRAADAGAVGLDPRHPEDHRRHPRRRDPRHPGRRRADADRLVQPDALVLNACSVAAAGAVGMYLSYHLEIPSGTTIVLVNAVVFAIVLIGTGTPRPPSYRGNARARRGGTAA